jgi:hypothetical protein
MGKHAEVLEVSGFDAVKDRDSRLRAFELELPQAGTRYRSYAIPFAGWVLGGDVPVRAIDLNVEERRVARLPVHIRRPEVAEAFPDVEWASQSGFRGPIGAATVPATSEFRMTALLDDGSRQPIGTLSISRRSLMRRPESVMQPTVITMLGRSGSTWLTWLVSRHPQVVAYTPYDAQPTVAAHQLEVFRALAEPSSYLQAVRAAAMNADWWLGRERSFPPLNPEPDAEAWLGSEGVESLLAVSCERIEAFYGEVARSERRPASRFVEKYGPHPFLQDLLWEVYPGMRELFLVRDFRDTIASILAYSRRGGLSWPRPEGIETDEQFVREFMSRQVGGLLDAWSRRSKQAMLVKYEDLASAPTETLGAIFSYLDLDASGETVERALTATAPKQSLDYHRTSADLAGSVGRWRTDLSPSVRRACDEALAAPLEAFGYS